MFININLTLKSLFIEYWVQIRYYRKYTHVSACGGADYIKAYG